MANIPHGYRIERDKAVVELTQAEQALRKCPEISAVRKPYTAAYRFQLVMAEEAFHPGMNRYDVIEALYCLLEPSENGRKSASDEERAWIKNRLSNCAPLVDEKESFLFHEKAHDKYENQLSEKERERHIREEYIRELRTSLGYSRRRFSKEVGIGESTLFLIEHGKMAASNSIMERIETRFPRRKNL